MEDELTHM
jgi:hypothetical protein